MKQFVLSFLIILALFPVEKIIGQDILIDAPFLLINSMDLPKDFVINQQRTGHGAANERWNIATDPITGIQTFLPGYYQRVIFSGPILIAFSFHFTRVDDQTMFEKAKQAGLSSNSALSDMPIINSSFTGKIFGEETFTSSDWHPLNKIQSTGTVKTNPPNMKSGGSYIVKYPYLFSGSYNEQGSFDFQFLDSILERVDKKATLLLTFRKVENIFSGISNKGIINSLQKAKLEPFQKAYCAGAYKQAGQHLKAFLNELEAQNGKHVPLATYNAIKTEIDKITDILQIFEAPISRGPIPISNPTNK